MNKFVSPGAGTAAISNDLIMLPADDARVDGPAGSDFHLRTAWDAIYRRRYVVAAIVALCVLLGLVAAMLTTPIYQAEATVQIDQEAAKVLETQDVEPGVTAQDAERFLQTQLDVIRSRALSIRVAEALGLFRNTAFLTAMEIAPPEAASDAARRAALRERVINVVQSNLTVDLPRSSRVASIGFTSPNPAVAARVANGFVEAYITSNLQRRFDASGYARRFLEERLAETKQRLEASERQAIAYARNARLIDTGGVAAEGSSAPQSSLVSTNLVQLNNAYSAARAARLQAQQRWQVAQATPLMNLPEVLANPAISQLQRSRAEAYAQYSQNRARYGQDHPLIVQNQAQVQEIDKQINRLAGTVRSSIRDQYQTNLQQENALQRDVGALQQSALAERDRSVDYNILKREADTNRSLYDALLQRYRELSAAAGITSNNISRIDLAEVPRSPISPSPILNMLLGGLGGLGLALMFVFVREKVDDVVRSPEDLERSGGVALLGTVPLSESGTSLEEALADQKSSISEAYSSIRTSLELASANGLPSSLFLTSSEPGEGKSTSALTIARAFAQIGKRTILIDADMRKPRLHRLLNVTNELGLSNVLARQKPITDVIKPSGTQNLDLVTCGPIPPNPAELFAGDAMREVLASFSGMYDLAVIDGPPVLGLADAPSIAAAAQATVFVAKANIARRGRVQMAVRRLLASRATILGTVLTSFDPKRAAYGSHYGYGYGYYSYGSNRDEA